jgi:hypothetical protein
VVVVPNTDCLIITDSASTRNFAVRLTHSPSPILLEAFLMQMNLQIFTPFLS